MTYLHHVTLTTGHVRHSDRAYILPETWPVVRALIREVAETGAAAVPGVSPIGCYVRHPSSDGPLCGRCVTLVVTGPAPEGSPLVTIGVGAHSRCGAVLWRRLHSGRDDLATRPDQVPPEPWCAARLEPGLALYPEAAHWLGDLERCLAWCWVEDVRERKGK